LASRVLLIYRQPHSF